MTSVCSWMPFVLTLPRLTNTETPVEITQVNRRRVSVPIAFCCCCATLENLTALTVLSVPYVLTRIAGRSRDFSDLFQVEPDSKRKARRIITTYHK